MLLAPDPTSSHSHRVLTSLSGARVRAVLGLRPCARRAHPHPVSDDETGVLGGPRREPPGRALTTAWRPSNTPQSASQRRNDPQNDCAVRSLCATPRDHRPPARAPHPAEPVPHYSRTTPAERWNIAIRCSPNPETRHRPRKIRTDATRNEKVIGSIPISGSTRPSRSRQFVGIWTIHPI